MGVMLRPALVVPLLLAVAVATGCASVNPPAARATSTPQARCLVDPHEAGARPLIFLFCIQSP
jgi:hypothetical protein